jgi:hypothetical protein
MSIIDPPSFPSVIDRPARRVPRRKPAAIHRDHLARDIGGVIRSEERDHRRDLLRCARAAERYGRQHRAQVVGVLPVALGHARLDHAWGDGVDQDTVGRELARELARELRDTRLGDRIGRGAGMADLAEHRGDVDDPPAGTREQRQQVAGDAQHGLEVGVDEAVDQRVVGLGERSRSADAGVVDQDVDATRRSTRGLGERPPRARRGDVEHQRLATTGRGGFHDNGIEIDTQHARAFRGEPARGRRTDAARRPGDDGGAAGEARRVRQACLHPPAGRRR